MANPFAHLTTPTVELPIYYPDASSHYRRRAREEYQKVQNNLCYYCDEHLSNETSKVHSSMNVEESLFPKGFFNNPVHLHHDHNTGMTIGAVHAYCNAILWQYHGE